MQQNNTEADPNVPKSPETSTQQTPINPAQFTRQFNNLRFAITPESIDMNLGSVTPTPTREPDPPLVDVKPYCERHNKKPITSLLADYKHESNASFHSSHSNTPKNSYTSVYTENYNPNSKMELNIRQSPSPSVSPKTPSQQWSFEHITDNESGKSGTTFSSQNLKSPGDHCLTYNSNLIAASDSQNSHLPNVTSLSEIPTSSNEQLQKYRTGSDVCMGNSAILNFKILNDLYSKRIEDIDANVWGDKDLKIITYQEWVELLAKINESLITNLDELEKEVAERLELVQKKVNSNCRHSQGNELMKCRKDIDTLLKYIRNARRFERWDLQGLTFETITPAQVLDIGELDSLPIEGNAGDAMKSCNDAEVLQSNKLYANMKALAHEVAEKHDEVRELKRQVICLEDEIQKAQKKIQLKDDVIKELRNDLKCANNKLSASCHLDPSLSMPPINLENQSSRSANTQNTDCNTPTFQDEGVSQFDSLSHTEFEEQQKLKILEEEISEFFEMNKELNKQKMESQRKRLMEVFQKLESEKASAYRKLDFIRRQIIALESDCAEGNNDCDSGFHSKSENDQDAKLLDGVRKRLRKLNETNGELKSRMQKLELDNNELSTQLMSEKKFSERNEMALKQIADLLCGMKDKQFSYIDIHNSIPSKVNPFCEAILEMRNDFQEKERQLLKALGIRNKENEELSQLLLKNEKDFNEERTTHLNLDNLKDIDKTPTALAPITSQSPPVTAPSSTSHAPRPTFLPTSLTGQQLDCKAAAFLQGLVEK